MPEIIKTAAGGLPSDADALRAGLAGKGCKTVAFPTETSYALGSTGLIKAATRRLLQIKERSTLKPLPVMVHSIEEAKKWVEWTPLAELLAAKLWPGAVALLLKPTAQGRLLTFPEYPNVAIRVPSHPGARAILAASGVPWVYTSANKSGRPPIADFAGVNEALGAELDFVVDGGTTASGEATIVDATGVKPRVTKVGLVSAELVQGALTA
ncbi:MAG TPA: L-threonylcarbamoyladenylate synthase [Elusimicrobiota bacterium]|jgi:L-threonylcarbamoyladenylate synthase|nr:L-threonylcarbamoyladenylate synthase [Elusimicrobiota bacterium]